MLQHTHVTLVSTEGAEGIWNLSIHAQVGRVGIALSAESHFISFLMRLTLSFRVRICQARKALF